MTDAVEDSTGMPLSLAATIRVIFPSSPAGKVILSYARAELRPRAPVAVSRLFTNLGLGKGKKKRDK